MLTWVSGLPVALCVGIALMSSVEVRIAGRSAVGVDLLLLLLASSDLVGGALAEMLFDIERWGMSLMLLYRDCLFYLCVSLEGKKGVEGCE